MKLRHLKVRHFKSLRDFEVDVDHFFVLIGQNNTGKSNVFYALQLFLSSTVRGIEDSSFSDFDRKQPMLIEGTFDDLIEEELEKLGPWTVDGVLTVQKEYASDESGKVTANYWAVMRVPQEPWLRDDFEQYSNREAVSRLPIAEFIPAGGRISKEAYARAIEEYKQRYPDHVAYQIERRQNPAGYKQVLDGYMPEFHLMPAVKDVTEETKTASSALLGKLLNVVIRRLAVQNPAFQRLKDALRDIRRIIEGNGAGEKLAEIRELERNLDQALDVWDVKVRIDVEAPDVERIFELGTNVNVDDGVITDIADKGHGLQRSLIFALFRVWAIESRRRTSEEGSAVRQRSNIFAFEEPELFLHPQIARATYETLKEIAATEQVMISTHSPHFVNMEDYRQVVIMRKPSEDEGSKALRVAVDLFGGDEGKKKRFNMIRFFNPDRNELFFARRVALVEGPTEKAAIPVVARRLGVFDHDVSIIDCAGKNNIELYLTVLNAFSIPYVIAYDEDPEDPEKLALNSIIENLVQPDIGTAFCIKPEFERAAGISASVAEKLGKPLAAVEHFSDEGTPIAAELEQAVRSIYV